MIVDRIIAAESGGDRFAKNPRSTATGLGQFIESTFLDLIRKSRPDLAEGKSRDEILALRTDPAISRDMIAALADENSKILTGAGIEASPQNVFLAHFAGPQGAINVLRADPTTPVGSILGNRVIQANPFLAGKSVADLIAFAGRKSGGPAQPVGAPLPIAPTQAAASPQAAPAASGGVLGGAFGSADGSGVLGADDLLKFAFAGLGGAAAPQGLLPIPATPVIRGRPVAFARRR